MRRGGHAIAWLALALLVAPEAVRGQEVAQAVPADAQCPVLPDERWTPQEKFVWSRVCIGAVADFDSEPGYGGDLDPRKPEGLPQGRTLTSAFIETILLKDTYRRALTRRGVRIVGARLAINLDLVNASIGHELWLERSLLEQGADFTDAKTTEGISLNGSEIRGTLDMHRLRAEKSIGLQGGMEVAGLNLTGARIGGDLLLSGSKSGTMLVLDDIEVGRSLYATNSATFPGVEATGAHIRGALDLSGAVLTGPAYLEGMEIGTNLFLGKTRNGDTPIGTRFSCPAPPAKRGETADVAPPPPGDMSQTENPVPLATCIDLTSTKVAGALDFGGSTVEGGVYADSLGVGEIAFLGYGAVYGGAVRFLLSKIGTLDLSAATFHRGVDLTGTAIAGELRLGARDRVGPRWGPSAGLVLRNASADAIQDAPGAWPDSLDLIGFTYRNLGGWSGDASAAAAGETEGRELPSLEIWLGRQHPYSPQPYEQLAGVLRLEGRPDDADEILYVGRERDRLEARSFWHGVKATALKLIIGYGYHLWWSVYWFLALWTLGAVIQGTRLGLTAKELKDPQALWRLAPEVPRLFVYSFEMLLPVVRFRGQTRDFTFGWQDVYFHVHGLAGLALAAFLAAGLAGLTK